MQLLMLLPGCLTMLSLVSEDEGHLSDGFQEISAVHRPCLGLAWVLGLFSSANTIISDHMKYCASSEIKLALICFSESASIPLPFCPLQCGINDIK